MKAAATAPTPNCSAPTITSGNHLRWTNYSKASNGSARRRSQPMIRPAMNTVTDSLVFPDGDFRPLPLLGNPHVQTLLAYVLAGSPFEHPTTTRVVPLSDGDRL